jgi:4-amino-4-deoxy-L-arabinose transferase-like glycosyltransferase
MTARADAQLEGSAAAVSSVAPASRGGSAPLLRWPQGVGPLEALLWVCLAVALVHAIYYLVLGLNNPALDQYNFRQTQTALTAYWFWREGLKLAYETPVVGYPWSVPFELPVYQALVALLRLFGVPIDAGGRLANFAFTVATLYPLWLVTRSLGLNRIAWLVTAVLYLGAPLYTYWGRTVMIESTAVFFAVFMVAMTARFMEVPRWRTWLAAFAFASLAVLTKATTFPAYALAAGILVLAKAWPGFRQAPGLAALIRPAAALAALVAALAVGFMWVWWTDQVKLANPIGAYLTSAATAAFTLGTWAERISAEFWVKAIVARTLPDIFGPGAILAVVGAAAALQSGRHRVAMMASLAAFLVPLLLFTNLYYVHSYYPTANALLAIAAVAIGIAAIADRGQPWVAAVVTVGILVTQIAYFQATYDGVIRADFREAPEFVIAEAAKRYVGRKDALLVLGRDWSSAIPYYSRRKSLAVPNWVATPLLGRILDDPEAFLGKRRLGGVVYCDSKGFGDRTARVDAFIRARTLIAKAGPCKLLSAAPN